ncbi:hypothetical protein AURDEDRAFT_173836 [Auricularia subglabra TFB-10046 SS5]|uniref:F-box domain-containing protein n=1 Tax=Auricularia subglabra (strain TFB-10046 / SS5) TaxID=717982 RepID=J0DAB3_AURST|nr:hypothetical protein AURDEDRAFT_173836 [Auricularia subglabra TFB-10046 SS5]
MIFAIAITPAPWSHIRTLNLLVPRDMLHQNLRASLTMPAPLLVSLELRVTDPHRPSDEEPAHFPPDLFSGHALKLSTVLLGRVNLPLASWTPLNHLEHLKLIHRSVHLDDLVEVLRACRALSTLYIRIIRSTSPAHWSGITAPASMRKLQHAYLDIHSMSISEINCLLSASGLETPRRCHIVWTEDGREWLIPPDVLHATTTLRIYETYRATTVSARVVTAIDADSCARSTAMTLPTGPTALHKFRRLFPTLRRLTIGEKMWPSPRPAMPQLEELTIILDRPTNEEPDGSGAVLGIFFLPLSPGREWSLPALRQLQLAYLDPTYLNLDFDDEESPENWRPPLVVSAYNVAIFLEWHLRSQQKLAVALSDVRLYEVDEHSDTLRLLALVDSLDQRSAYDPEGYELGWDPHRQFY